MTPHRDHARPRASDPAAAPADATIGETRPATYVLTRAAVRELDRLAQERYLIPSIVLMENAARQVARVALGLLDGQSEAPVRLYCGPGNNGGDGFAAARHLHNAGTRVEIVLAAAPDRYTGDAAINLRIVERMGLPIIGMDGPPQQAAAVTPVLIVDALLGTGLDRPVTGPIADLIGQINELRRAGSRVLAVDLPSGLDADTGHPLGVAVRADVTVTFAGTKPGLCRLEAQPYVGDVVIADIGAPRELAQRLGIPLPEVPPDHP